MKRAQRLAKTPPYLFAEIDKKVAEAKERGVDVISLGIGDPDRPTPHHIIESLNRAAADPENHRYPSYVGMLKFRQAVADWYDQRFNVSLDAESEVMTLIGSKEGLAHIIWAFVEAGDVGLVPDPGYPVYRTHVALAGGEPYPLPLLEQNGFKPDLDSIPEAVRERATILFLNYPNNPTAATVDIGFFEHAVRFAQRYDILIVHDAAYSEITYDGYEAPSILEVDGAKEVAVEMHSLSKTYNMTGWRIGMAVGNRQALEGLGVIKTNTDSGQFNAIQEAGITALTQTPQRFHEQRNEVYRKRRDLLVDTFAGLGIDVVPPRGTFYLWCPLPEEVDSFDFAERLLTETGLVVTPGAAYGEAGAGYFRVALTLGEDRLREAVERLNRVDWSS